ncbi:DNA-directed RNA polymerase subunit delta [Jeotgalibacillus salarius]|uniref:Probable DNA-directed RNA polymerase subunit delta n=1 Tax=Jeotgalibacillus salarius TaxID=546023 RepID=A0A4Y8LT62_9BACL|nr:DNA-directed RNA polymerase subunit delta [Jeotgalibacillus salarius]TFE04155.1 DNA-directed RNA polymerase subunit delta [Jeotgalibacillus salarius]
MELKNRSVEDLREYSFIEIAHQLLVDNHRSMTFNDMVDEWKRLLGVTDKEARQRVVQFYTDLNMDGRFIFLDHDKGWGLRSWYPLDQVEDEQITSEIQTTKKKKKKTKAKSKKKKKAEEDLDFDNLDDEEEDLVYDEIDDDVEDVEDIDGEEFEDDVDFDDLDDDDDDDDDDEEEDDKL